MVETFWRCCCKKSEIGDQQNGECLSYWYLGKRFHNRRKSFQSASIQLITDRSYLIEPYLSSSSQPGQYFTSAMDSIKVDVSFSRSFPDLLAGNCERAQRHQVARDAAADCVVQSAVRPIEKRWTCGADLWLIPSRLDQANLAHLGKVWCKMLYCFR